MTEYDKNLNQGLDSVFTTFQEKLNLSNDEAKIAKAFWSAFGKVVFGSKDDKERNKILFTELQNLGAIFSEITVKDIFTEENVPFYTVKIIGKQLILPSGNIKYIFRPDVDAPRLYEIYNLQNHTVNIGLPDLSIKIIKGGVEIHKIISKIKNFRNDLTTLSETMTSHFIQSILAAAERIQN